MPTKPLDRLIFAQGGLCFFCEKVLLKSEASVEHLVASANDGGNNDENCVACCKSINALLGSMSLKEKVQVVLNQKGQFKCPNTMAKAAAPKAAHIPPSTPKASTQVATVSVDKIAKVIANLRQHGASKPRTVKTLTSTVHSIFQKQLHDSEVQSLLKRLQEQGMVKFDGTKVVYSFSENAS